MTPMEISRQNAVPPSLPGWYHISQVLAAWLVWQGHTGAHTVKLRPEPRTIRVAPRGSGPGGLWFPEVLMVELRPDLDLFWGKVRAQIEANAPSLGFFSFGRSPSTFTRHMLLVLPTLAHARLHIAQTLPVALRVPPSPAEKV